MARVPHGGVVVAPMRSAPPDVVGIASLRPLTGEVGFGRWRVPARGGADRTPICKDLVKA